MSPFFRFVIVEPRYGGNVGSAARALKNLGFRRLVLVAPYCDPRGEEARRLAVDARDVLDGAEVHDTLDSALDGAGTVVGTSRRTGKHRKPHYRLDRLTTDIVRPSSIPSSTVDTALVFGREDHGLSDVELDRCTHLVHLPSDAAYPSFNVAQAILLVAYELRRAGLDPRDADPLPPPADHAEREAFYRHLERALDTIGYLHRDTVEPIMRRFRRLLGRASMSTDEVRLLRGMARQILWVADQAGLERASDDDPKPSGTER